MDKDRKDSRNPEVNIPQESPAVTEIPELQQILPSQEPITGISDEKTEKIKTLFSDIDNAEKIKDLLTGSALAEPCMPGLSISPSLSQSTETLRNINIIKDELCKLALDTCEADYITNCINPLLNILFQLSTVSYGLANSANLLSISPVVHPKKSELKDTVHLVYKINDKCQDVYDVLKVRLNKVLNSAEHE